MTAKGLNESDLPLLYQAADWNSKSGQRRYLRATQIRLVSLVTAAFFASITWFLDDTDWAGIVSASAFGAALLSELYLLRARPDRSWFTGRAVAESAKTLAWRYSVGGAPFPIDDAPGRIADERMLDRLGQIARDTPGMHLVPPAGIHEQITQGMRSLRASPLELRRAAYGIGRIQDQQRWYARRARENEALALRWSAWLAVLEGIGLIAAILKAASILDFDWLGVAGAIVASGVAWAETKQHQNLASAYGIAAQELAEISSKVNPLMSESEWAQFVDQSEEAISREHTMWRASHS
jgi:hypothetical protein